MNTNTVNHQYGSQERNDTAIIETSAAQTVSIQLKRKGAPNDVAEQAAISVGAMIRFGLAGAGLASIVGAAIAIATGIQ